MTGIIIRTGQLPVLQKGRDIQRIIQPITPGGMTMKKRSTIQAGRLQQALPKGIIIIHKIQDINPTKITREAINTGHPIIAPIPGITTKPINITTRITISIHITTGTEVGKVTAGTRIAG
jgi:hypothetical protein